MNANSNRKQGWIVFAVLAGVGLLVAVIAISATSSSPRPFIGSTYRCNLDPTSVKSVVCNSGSSATRVASAISSDVSPIDRRTASNGTIFLQYSDDIIAIKNSGVGAQIEVDDYDRGYAKHSTYIGVFGWSSSRPGGSGFGGFGK
ncbi:MAG TPA: DUF4247 domain-containing protein [Candidatus Stackebrandtia excrementipullorum]|nr:DUF4247 domain-containing protein [Candidatus Stackebrandtia excrementipullorum]